jgi:putative acetyltransferase
MKRPELMVMATADRAGFRVRQATPADALKIRNVHVQSVRRLCAKEYTSRQIDAWTAGRRPAQYRRAMETEGETMFVAERADRILGFGSLRQDEIRAVYVHPRSAGRGVGSALLAALERTARRSGVTRLHCVASLTAVSFYRACGYRVGRRVTHRLRNGAVLPGVRMTKRLG